MHIDTAGYFVYCVVFRLEDNTSGAVNSQHIRLLCVYVCTCTCYLMSVSVSDVLTGGTCIYSTPHVNI